MNDDPTFQDSIRRSLLDESTRIDVVSPKLGDLHASAGRAPSRTYRLLRPVIALGVVASVVGIGVQFVTSQDDGPQNVVADAPTPATSGPALTTTSEPDLVEDSVDSASTTVSPSTTELPTTTERRNVGESLIFYDGILLGSWNGADWVEDPQDLDTSVQELSVPSAEDNDFGVQLEISGDRLSLIPWCDFLDDGQFRLDSSSISSDELSGVSETNASWALQPRPIIETTSSDDRRDAVIDALGALGLDVADPVILGTTRVDLDGDGTDEVIIEATNGEPSFYGSRVGDYSIVLIRQIDTATGELVSIVVEASVTTGNEARYELPEEGASAEADGVIGVGSSHYRLEDLADLNGDGIYELIIGSSAWEGGGSSVYSYDGTKAVRRIGAGCGS